jgi:hypothetical protein
MSSRQQGAMQSFGAMKHHLFFKNKNEKERYQKQNFLINM